MYTETGLLFPYSHNSSQDIHQLEEFCKFQHKTNAPMSNLIQTSTISEYDLGGEGDLFKAPEPIIEDALLGLDPVTAAISMISCGEDVIDPQGLKLADIESIQNEQLLSEVFYECKKDLMEKAAIGTPFSDVLDLKIPFMTDNHIPENKLLPGVPPLAKSVSSGSLSSMDLTQGPAVNPRYLDFSGMDFGTAYGMRRAYSEGDMKALSSSSGSSTSGVHSPFNQPPIVGSRTAEDRKEKLSRYRNKKTKRNFGRKIKYACRKALADSQPRIRGRFARTDDSDISKRQ